jgi:hypothetical protein
MDNRCSETWVTLDLTNNQPGTRETVWISAQQIQYLFPVNDHRIVVKASLQNE